MTDLPVILITGAARRVGADIARALHAAGGRVAIHYRRSATEAGALAAELDALRANSAAAFAADLLDTAALPALVETVVARFGRLDALVNNASSFFPTPFGAIDGDAWADLAGSNLGAPLFLSQAAAPHLAASSLAGGGCIVNITDIHADRPLEGYSLYCAAKSGLNGLTRALALELAPAVRVNAVAPGAVVWPEDGSFSPAERSAVIARTLLKRAGTPMDVARAVKFLIFDAPYVTGQIINVDGGRSVRP